MTRSLRLLTRWRSGLPWTDVYGLARTLLATGTLLTLLANHSTALFRPLGSGSHDAGGVSSLIEASLFALVPVEHLELARWGAVAALLLIASGWRPRITGLLHWWISFSVAVSVVPVDGGDQVAAILALLLIPVTLTDARRWHWSVPDQRETRATPYAVDLARSTFWVIRLQVAVIYLHASVGKMGAVEWANGTALYYWLLHPLFGVVEPLQPAAQLLLSHSLPVLLLTWGVILFELLLFTALVQPRQWWGTWLVLGVGFHFGIAVFQGLVSFFFAMAGALVLYLRPVERPFGLAPFASAIRSRAARASVPAVLGARSAAAGHGSLPTLSLDSAGRTGGAGSQSSR